MTILTVLQQNCCAQIFSPKLFAKNLFTRRQILLRKAKDYKGYPDEKSVTIVYHYLGAVAKIADKAGTAHARLVAPKVMRAGKRFAALRALERLVQGGNIVGVLLEVPVLRIHNILVWIRIRMRILH
jgi:hypothetical protein